MKFQKWIQVHKKQITLATGLLIILGYLGKLLQWSFLYQGALILASIIAVLPIAMHAYQALKVKVISIEVLVTLAVVGAFAIGEYHESAIVTFLFLFGSYLEEKTLNKTRESIKTLTQMAPTVAEVLQDDGSIKEVDVEEVEIGEVVLVKTGGAIPVDGVVVSGKGYANEAAVTGEAKEVAKVVGEEVYSGTILTDGFLKVSATKVGDDTTFAKIIELVEEAQDTKSHAEKFIDRFAKYYTPAVLVIALLVLFFTKDLRLAITVLVLGCPGALVIGAPVSNVAGIGNGAKAGILVKGGEAMDTFSKIDTFVFDKTGTLTKGVTTVSHIVNYTDQPKESLRLAASLEQLSDHPLGKAIIQSATKENLTFENLIVTQQQTIKGQGLSAVIANQNVLVGNEKLMEQNGIFLTSQQKKEVRKIQKTGSSLVLVAINGKLTQIIGISDEIRPEVHAQLNQLKKSGVKHLVMLTGDNQLTADYVAEKLGIEEVHAELLPEEKVEFVKKMQASGRKVAFVGDGINDAPSLATANIGIAMGSGTDVAIETSDIVLMQSNFSSLVHAYQLAKKTVLNTKENVVIAIAVVLFLLIGLLMGFIYMASGMLVHEASILVVILNAMRLIHFKSKENLTEINFFKRNSNYNESIRIERKF